MKMTELVMMRPATTLPQLVVRSDPLSDNHCKQIILSVQVLDNMLRARQAALNNEENICLMKIIFS